MKNGTTKERTNRITELMDTKEKAQTRGVTITKPAITSFTIGIRGLTNLLTDRIADDVAVGHPKYVKASQKSAVSTPKTDTERYASSKYIDAEGRDVFPVGAVKRAMVSAVNILRSSGQSKLSGKAVAPLFSVSGSDGSGWMRLKFKKVQQNGVIGRNRNSGGSPVWVVRAEYIGWEAEVTFRFNSALITEQSLINLLALAGQVGIGAWRAENRGTYGSFEVVETAKKKGS